jgi:hypothetical protein
MPAKAGIQYSVAFMTNLKRLRLLDRPVKPDDDASLE